MKTFDRDIVSGSVYRSVWKLTWPVTLLNLINGAHGFVHQILIGHFVVAEHNAANAAVGMAWQVFLVVVVFIASLFHGMNVLIARYAGRQDRENLSRVAFHAFLASVYILVFIMAPLGYLLAPHLLRFVETPPDVYPHALPYLRIMFTCGAPLFLMFMFTGAFQASGEPKTPLKLGILSTILNIIISSVLITGAGPFPHLGTVGAALGTVLAATVSVSIAIGLILRRRMIILPPSQFTLIPDLSILKVITRIGVPTGIQGVLLNVGGVFLLRFIGTLENAAAALAAYTICYSQLFNLVSWVSFGLRSAAGTVMGQNIGAGDPRRGKHGVAIAALLGGVWAAFIGLFFWAVPIELLGLFGAVEGPVRAYGTSLLHYLSLSGIFLATALALTGGLQGAGETKLPMYIAFLTQIVILLGICSYYQGMGALTTERVWMAILISHGSRLLLTWLVFRTEKWAHTVVEID
ncbi:MAG: MATE family efflux transporter [Candidatus Hydrogenedentes bacterium]|nr:MATE family efflux transporter [Candidatus Hydrogenedentota bacterium]MBI3119770.1 MATE family efflux transporter [Candidatus Hydrogenedentota bacterium]